MQAPATVSVRKGEEILLNEMYVSVQGESSLVGLPTVFVRLYACNLRCAWCDSMHAVEGGEFTRVSVDEVVGRIRELAGASASAHEGIRNVCWTGGEPLLQGETIAAAIRRLPDTFVHSFETDGEVDLRAFDRLVPAERDSGRVR
ncbi:MAG: radical SAM protein, partial [Thermoplasmata archaeon]